jgi:outer membrane protein assembly factor BamE (lipoprotein component of BamABCDE complex)
MAGIQTGFMKKAIFALAAMAAFSVNSFAAPEVSAKDGSKSWANFVAGKTTEDRWASIGKAAPKLLGMTRAEVEKCMGKGTYSDKQEELMYLISDESDKANVFDNISISFDKNGKVKSFVIVTKSKD